MAQTGDGPNHRPMLRLREIRKAKGLTLEVLAEQAGTTAPTIQRIETGETWMSRAMMKNLCDALQIEPRDLFQSATAQDDLGEIAALMRRAPPEVRREIEEYARFRLDRLNREEG